jgi:hypothetical protein
MVNIGDVGSYPSAIYGYFLFGLAHGVDLVVLKLGAGTIKILPVFVFFYFVLLLLLV